MTTERTVHDQILSIAVSQFNGLGLFEYLYVKQDKNGSIGSYVVVNANDHNQILFYRSVDLITGEETSTGSAFLYETTCVLNAHYTLEYIRTDCLQQLIQCATDKEFPEGKHVVFGQTVFYQDLWEMHILNAKGEEITVSLHNRECVIC